MLKPATMAWAEKIEALERVIEHMRSERNEPGAPGHETLQALKAIAQDYRAKNEMAIALAEVELNSQIGAIRTGGITPGRMENLGHLALKHWPVIRQALQKFGALEDEAR